MKPLEKQKYNIKFIMNWIEHRRNYIYECSNMQNIISNLVGHVYGLKCMSEHEPEIPVMREIDKICKEIRIRTEICDKWTPNTNVWPYLRRNQYETFNIRPFPFSSKTHLPPLSNKDIKK